MSTKQLRETRKVELVETHNLALALTRLKEADYYWRWKRALYHALAMVETDNSTLEKIRQALGLP